MHRFLLQTLSHGINQTYSHDTTFLYTDICVCIDVRTHTYILEWLNMYSSEESKSINIVIDNSNL